MNTAGDMTALDYLRAENWNALAPEALAKAVADAIDSIPVPPDEPASRLIDLWAQIHGKPIPWAKAVEIVAVVKHMPDEERQRLLSLDGPT